MRVVVDANIAFRALAAGRGDLRTRLDSPASGELYAPFFVLVELYKHKERIQQQSALSEENVLTALHELCECVNFIREADIELGTWMQAFRLTKDVDAKDTPHVALTMHLGARLWTLDEALMKGLRERGFNAFWEP